MINILLALWLLVSAFFGVKFPKPGLFIALLLIPTYLIHLVVLAIPTNFFELTLLAFAVGYLFAHRHLGAALFKSYVSLRWPLLVLVLGLTVGVLTSAHTLDSLGIVKSWFVVPLILFGLITNIAQDDLPEVIAWPLLLSTLPISLFALYQRISGVGITPDGRVGAWFASPNYLALYIVPIILLATALVTGGRPQWQKASAALTIGLGLVSVFLAFSYGGWLGLAVGTLALLVLRWPKHSLKALAGLVVIGLLGLLTQLHNPRFLSMLDLSNRSSASVRLQVWATDLFMLRQHWLTGIGLGEYSHRYLSFAEQLFHPPLETGILHGHNFFLQFGLEMGILGWVFLGLLGIVVCLWIKKAKASWIIPVTAALVSILAHGLVDTSYWKNDLSAVFWAILALLYLGYTQGVKGSHHD